MEEKIDSYHDVFTIIENMASVYDLEKTTLKEFVCDVKRAHSLYLYLCNVTHKIQL